MIDLDVGMQFHLHASLTLAQAIALCGVYGTAGITWWDFARALRHYPKLQLAPATADTELKQITVQRAIVKKVSAKG